MIRRTYVGIDIHPTGLTFAGLQRGRPVTRVTGARQEVLDGVVEFSSRQPNVRHAQRFIDALRRGVEGVAGSEERLAISLPDRVGRLYLTEIETPFKTRQEGVEILKWRLKGGLPAAPAQVHLDYQVLDSREDGRLRCIVSAIAQPILEQYESLIGEAGLHAAVIDFHSLNLYNYYRPRLDLGDEFILVGLEDGMLGIQFFSGKLPVYQRVRQIGPVPERVFQEINRSLVEAYTSYPIMKRCAVYAHVDPSLAQAMDGLLPAAFEREVKVLDPNLKRFGGESLGGWRATGTLLAALGAAERLM